MTAYISAPALDFLVEIVDGTAAEVQLRVADLVRLRASAALGPGGGNFVNFAALPSVRVTEDNPASWLAYSAGGTQPATVVATLGELEPL